MTLLQAYDSGLKRFSNARVLPGWLWLRFREQKVGEHLELVAIEPVVGSGR